MMSEKDNLKQQLKDLGIPVYRKDGKRFIKIQAAKTTDFKCVTVQDWRVWVELQDDGSLSVEVGNLKNENIVAKKEKGSVPYHLYMKYQVK